MAPKTLETYLEALSLRGRFLAERGMPGDPVALTRDTGRPGPNVQ
jgi:hypothetical protein